MRRICAWCGTDLGVKESPHRRESEPAADSHTGQPVGDDDPEGREVTSTICPGCAEGLAAYRKPVLVVSREWARMYEDLVEMLKGRPEIQVVLDRRQSVSGGADENGWDGPDRRRKRNPFSLE